MEQGPVIATLHSMSDVWDAYRGELDGVEDRESVNPAGRQHAGFALAAASRYYVMEAGRITSTGAGVADAHADVRAAMAI